MSIKTFGVKPAMFYEDPEGAWVREEDHVAEVERLTGDVERWASLYQHLADATERLRADLAAARADYLEVAKALGITYEPDQGPVYTGELVEVLRAIHDLNRAAEERDEARAAHVETMAELMWYRAIGKQMTHPEPAWWAVEPKHYWRNKALAALPTPPEQEGTE